MCQCSGNRRGLSQPHVAGVEWGYGAMGCATWRGPRLKDVLAKAGVKPAAVEVWLDGADGPVLPTTPDFLKALPMEKAMADEVIIATSMNGQPLPHLNGYPARVIVPGWTATYWMKHVTNIQLSSKPLDNFWMQEGLSRAGGHVPGGSPVPLAGQSDDLADHRDGGELGDRRSDRRNASARGRLHDRGRGMGPWPRHQAGGGVAGRWQELEGSDAWQGPRALQLPGFQLPHRQDRSLATTWCRRAPPTTRARRRWTS